MRRKQTSIDAHNSVKPHKQIMWSKIEEGMMILKVGGTFEMIAQASGLEPAQTWKRLSEMQRNGIIFDVGITKPTSSGRKATVWQLIALLPKTDKQLKLL